MVAAFKVLTDSVVYPEVKAGMLVYKCARDYDCALDDTRATGVEHGSFTLDPNGGYPFFTLPVEMVDGAKKPGLG